MSFLAVKPVEGEGFAEAEALEVFGYDFFHVGLVGFVGDFEVDREGRRGRHKGNVGLGQGDLAVGVLAGGGVEVDRILVSPVSAKLAEIACGVFGGDFCAGELDTIGSL